MLVSIKTKTMAYENKVEKIDATHFIVSVKEPPQNGLANKGIVRNLAEYFKVAPSRVVIKRGFTSKNKTVEII